MMDLLKNAKVVLFGAGYMGSETLEYLINEDIFPAYFVDNNPNVKNRDKITVTSPEVLLKENKSLLRIIVTPISRYRKEIEDQLNEMGLSECIWDYTNDNEQRFKFKYFKYTRKKLDLKNPRTYDEKIIWLQLHDHDIIYQRLTDKLLVKNYVTEKIGKKYVTPVIGIWDNADDIAFEDLPDEYVLKCNHDSAGVFIKHKCASLSQRDIQGIRKMVSDSLCVDYFDISDSWCYKGIKPKVFAEKLIYTHDNERLVDYKFFCFNGKPKFLYAAKDRESVSGVAFYDIEYNRIPVRALKYPNGADIPKPAQFDEMIYCCKKLSKEIPFVRVDLYVDGHGAVLFGEMTFCPSGGVLAPYPEEYNIKFGGYLDLSVVKNQKRGCK
jgi:hypothetical protein